MTGERFEVGFIVRGGPGQARRVCDWRAAFGAFADCDPKARPGTEAYLSMFTFGADFIGHMRAHGGPKGFGGATGGPFVWMDFDGRGALDDVRRLCIHWDSEVGGDTAPLVFFSGGKGFHVGVPSALMDAQPGPLFHASARAFAESLARDADAAGTLDTAVYDRVRLFRAPNSRHAKSGLCKVALEADGMVRLSESRILELARTPREFEVPEVHDLDFGLAHRWKAATEAAQATEARRAERKAAAATGAARMNPSTLQFIRDGADHGERALRLFQAAANLSECGAPARLVLALLEEPALDAGLPPGEVARQIKSGIEHGGRAHE